MVITRSITIYAPWGHDTDIDKDINFADQTQNAKTRGQPNHKLDPLWKVGNLKVWESLMHFIKAKLSNLTKEKSKCVLIAELHANRWSPHDFVSLELV